MIMIGKVILYQPNHRMNHKIFDRPPLIHEVIQYNKINFKHRALTYNTVSRTYITPFYPSLNL